MKNSKSNISKPEPALSLFFFIALVISISIGMVAIVFVREKALDLEFLWRIGPVLIIALSPYLGLAAINKWLARERDHFFLLWFITILISIVGLYNWIAVLFVKPAIWAWFFVAYGFAFYQWLGVLVGGVVIFLHRLYAVIKTMQGVRN